MMDIKTVVINGIDLEYCYIKRSKICLLFVHGVGGNLSQFKNQMSYFKNYSTLAVSLRGHGKSNLPKKPKEEAMTIATLAKDLLALINYLEIEKIHFVGNSAGGIIGYELAKINSNNILTLTTFGTALRLKISPFIARLVVKIDKFMIRNFSNKYFRFIAKSVTHKEDVKKQTVDMFTQAKEAIPLFRSNISDYDYTDFIEGLNFPYLIIKGSKDKEINKEIDKIKNVLDKNDFVKVVEIKKAGHLANLDQPEKFNKILSKFLQKVESRDESV